jgi:ATP-binding cassette, subfamily C (CFTR/MRP), member 1
VLVPLTNVSILSAVFRVISGTAVVALVILDDRRTVRPPALLSLYLLCSAAVDGIELRSLLLRNNAVIIAYLLPVSFAGKFALLVLDSWPRRLYLKSRDDYSPEELAGIISQALFWWIDPILRIGNRQILGVSDLYPLPHELRSNSVKSRFAGIWLGRQ